MPAPALDNSLITQIGAAVRRRLEIGTICADTGRLGSVDIGRIDIDGAAAETVRITDFEGRVRCGAAVLKNLRAILELHFEVHWSYDLKGLGSDSGTKTLGSKAKTIPIHDLRIPMLQDIAFEAPEVEASDATVAVNPVENVALGPSVFDTLAVETTRAPSSGFRIAGFGVRALNIDRLAAPDADAAALRVGRFAPEAPVRLPDISLGPIELPEIEVDDAGSAEPVSIMDIQTEVFEAPAFKIGDLFKVIFVVRPVLHFQIGELVLTDLVATASIGGVAVEGLSASIEAHDIRARDLALGGFAVEDVRL